jgi:tRNA 2-selenouridine synthase
VVIEEYYGEAVDVLMEMYGVDLPAVFLWTFMETSGGRSFTRLSSRFSGPNPQSAGWEDRHDYSRLSRWLSKIDNATGDVSLHRLWAAALLEYYYDPMYEFQLAKREGPSAVRGERDAVIEWAKTATAGQMKPTEQH